MIRPPICSQLQQAAAAALGGGADKEVNWNSFSIEGEFKVKIQSIWEILFELLRFL